MFQRKVKKSFITAIVGVLLLVSPFTVYANDGPYTTFTVNEYTCYQFFQQYGFRVNSENLGLQEEYPVESTIDCVSTGDGYGCTLYNYQVRTSNNMYFPTLQGAFTANEGYVSQITTPKQYDANNRIRVGLEPVYIFYFSQYNTTTNNLHIYTNQNNHTVHATRVTTDSQSYVAGTYYLICLKVWADTVPTEGTTKGYVFASIDLGWINGVINDSRKIVHILPVYYGTRYTMPEDVYYYIFNEPKPQLSYDAPTYELLDNGNDDTQDLIDENNDITDDLTVEVNNINTLEDDFISDMNDSIDDIDFNNQFLNNGNLVSSMRWVKDQYDSMTDSNIIGSFIQYALLFGLGLLILGRF